MHGFVATGTMGEAGSLSDAERRAVIEATARAAAGERAGDRGRLGRHRGRRLRLSRPTRPPPAPMR